MVSKLFPEWVPGPDSSISLHTPSHQNPATRLPVVQVKMGACNFYYKDSGRLSSLPSYDHRVTHPEVCPRVETVMKLADLLDKKRIVHIRGTPSSGKTTLAGLLVDYYRENKEPVVFINNWKDDNADPIAHLQQHCAAKGYHHHAETRFWQSNMIFVIDEAQSSYSDSAFWLGVIKTHHGSLSGPRFCLFSSYGSPTTGAPPYQYLSRTTPVHLGPAQRVGITRLSLPDSPNVCLFYDQAEFTDVIDRTCARLSIGINIDADAREYLYAISNGHPGAVNALVTFIAEANRHELKHASISKISKEIMMESLEDHARVFRTFESFAVFRSFPVSDALTMPVVRTLRRCLEHGTIPCDLNDEGVKRCYELGWLHSDQTKSYAIENPKMVCFFPSRLHEKFVEYILYTSQPRPFPLEQFASTTALCGAIIRRFSQKNLMSSVEIELAPSRSCRPPEAQFQDEFYRCFFSVVGYGVGLSSEWSRAGGGRIDFRVVDPGWGVEILRDGDRLSDHCNRFEPGGAYHPWIAQGYLTDWLILDFRHTVPQKYGIPNTKMWRIVFQDKYASAYVVDSQNEIVIPEFPLLQSEIEIKVYCFAGQQGRRSHLPFTPSLALQVILGKAEFAEQLVRFFEGASLGLRDEELYSDNADYWDYLRGMDVN
ncbi:hypothetical protein BJX76DRAFT_357720 [Aspergillus varians]